MKQRQLLNKWGWNKWHPQEENESRRSDLIFFIKINSKLSQNVKLKTIKLLEDNIRRKPR